ncbi:transposase [Streptomyces sp. NBC_01571]|nr:transposase [Streptomyces sp. NBC_01571]
MRRHVAEQMCEATRPEVWVVDDVVFPKCGTACARSPAVLRRVGQAGELTGPRSACTRPRTPPSCPGNGWRMTRAEAGCSLGLRRRWPQRR